MRDLTLEELIERLTAALDRWSRYTAIYQKALKGRGVRTEEGQDFGQIRQYLVEKYPGLMRDLGSPVDKDDLTLELLTDVDGVDELLNLPDMMKRKFESHMAETEAGLKEHRERLEGTRKELEVVTPFEYRMRRFLARKKLVAGLAVALGLLFLWAVGVINLFIGFIKLLIQT